MAINRTYPTLPVVDLDRAKKFYQQKLGFKVVQEDPSPGALLRADDGYLYLYQRAATKADHTVAALTVSNVEATMQELRGKGIAFEEYNLPNLKTVNGLFPWTAIGQPGSKTAKATSWQYPTCDRRRRLTAGKKPETSDYSGASGFFVGNNTKLQGRLGGALAPSLTYFLPLSFQRRGGYRG